MHMVEDDVFAAVAATAETPLSPSAPNSLSVTTM
jgi:hypothetical protein